MHSFRLNLISAVWLAITGAAYANQGLLIGSLSPGLLGALSVILWAVHAVAAGVLFYALIPPQTLPSRVRATFRLCYPLVVSSWCLVLMVFYLGMSTHVLVPLMLLSLSYIWLWWGEEPQLAWGVAILASVLAFVSLFLPKAGPWLVVLACVGFVVLAMFSRTAKWADEEAE